MSRKLVPLLLALSLANGSCCYTGNPNGGWDLYTLAIRNLSSEPPRGHDWMSINFKIKGWAGKAWRETVKDSPDQHYSADYEKGFKEGFRDYVEFGGCGEPPAVPTLCYRSAIFRTPAGQQAIQDWYDGFRHGSHVAMESGLRETILVPLACGIPPTPASQASKQPGTQSGSSSGMPPPGGYPSAYPGGSPATPGISPTPGGFLPGMLPGGSPGTPGS